MAYIVRPILAGQFGPVRESVLYRNGRHDVGRMVPSYIYHAHSDDHDIIVDMSFSSPQKCNELLGLECQRETPLEELLRANGVVPEKVDMVICTHLHWDHAGNGRLFPKARIICQRAELAFALAPPPWEQGYSREFAREIVEVLERVEPVEGDARICEGVEVVHLGGHTAGSQAVVIGGVDGNVIIAGDTVMTLENLERNTPIGLFTDQEECVRALDWLRRQEATVYPGHGWCDVKRDA